MNREIWDDGDKTTAMPPSSCVTTRRAGQADDCPFAAKRSIVCRHRMRPAPTKRHPQLRTKTSTRTAETCSEWAASRFPG